MKTYLEKFGQFKSRISGVPGAIYLVIYLGPDIMP